MTNCKCQDKRACQVREARGLVPFCLMPTPVTKKDPNAYGSYAEAELHSNGRRIKSVGNYLQGSPRCFIIVGGAA